MTEKSSVDRPEQEAFAARLRDNLARIREEIAAACAACGRAEEEITLLGVTKTVPADRINMAIEAGIDRIGENRVQEFLQKREELRLEGVGVHLIGHLQTNKVERIVGLVDRIESVDSLRVAQAIDAASRKRGIVTEVLVEVNIGGEEAKSGAAPEETEELLCQMAEMQGLRVRGLMTVPPIADTERERRGYFSRMKKLFVDIRDKNIDNIHMDVLSMGMSGDYVQAIREGSTEVRIGSALFGSRVYPPA